MYPKLIIDIKKLDQNLNNLGQLLQQEDCSLMVVTKALCADTMLVRMIAENEYVSWVADSRVKNLATYSSLVHDANKKTALLRIPMHSEINEVVKHADLSFNSEESTLLKLDKAAKDADKMHEILIMIDLGDLREGIFFENIEQILHIVDVVEAADNLYLAGIGTNLTCYGAIIPKNDNLSKLEEVANLISEHIGRKLEIVSGGNSSSVYLIDKKELPKGINNLRLGESFLLGNDTAYGQKIQGCNFDAIKLQCEIVELQIKPSMPIGEIGVDAFGNKPVYEDNGVIKRAILGIGKQDVDIDGIICDDKDVMVIGGSSDHTILDVTNSNEEYKVGDILEFSLDYSALLRCATSKYVERAYKK